MNGPHNKMPGAIERAATGGKDGNHWLDGD